MELQTSKTSGNSLTEQWNGHIQKVRTNRQDSSSLQKVPEIKGPKSRPNHNMNNWYLPYKDGRHMRWDIAAYYKQRRASSPRTFECNFVS